MRPRLTLRPAGNALLALLATSVVLASPAHAQAPPFLLQWGVSFPAGVAVDAAGLVYVTTTDSARIIKFTADGAFITSWPSVPSFPVAVAVGPGGDVYVANISFVRRYTSDGVLLAEWPAGMNGAWAVAVDAAGDVYTADVGINRIQKFTGSGGFVAKWGTLGTGPGQLYGANCVAVDAAGTVYVTDGTRARVLQFTSTGDFITEWGSQGAGPGEFNSPGSVAVAGNGGAIYVVDGINDRIEKFGQVPTAAKATSWGRLKRMFR